MKTSLFLLPLAGLALVFSAYLVTANLKLKPDSSSNTNGVACGRETKSCPDGTVVGRELPSCGFASCPDLNTNSTPPTTNTVVNDSTLTNQSQKVTVVEAMQQAEQLDNQSVCVTGFFQSSFEFFAFGSGSRVDSSGWQVATEPYIWVNPSVDVSTLNCTRGEEGEKTCTGMTTVCGTFRYAAPNEPGFGHVGSFRYKLE